MPIPSEELYRYLYFARRCEEYVIKHYPEDEMRTPMHMSMGQEHVPVGICRGLRGKGDIFASYRSHAAFLAQTMDSDRFFGELYGRVNGPAEGKGGSMHLSAPQYGHILSSGIVASPISVAVGAAFANQRLNTGRIAVVFFGDGAVDSGSFWESVNAASLFKLPVFFICEDNGLAVHTQLHERRGYESLAEVVARFRCLVFEDDSNDVEQVYRLAAEAHASIQKNPQPVFMNIKCFRYLDHIGIGEDWHYGYRDPSEAKKWKDLDSLQGQRNRLREQGLSEVAIAKIESDLDAQIQESVKNAMAAPATAVERLHRGVFYETA